jgi:hypothetical protein
MGLPNRIGMNPSAYASGLIFMSTRQGFKDLAARLGMLTGSRWHTDFGRLGVYIVIAIMRRSDPLKPDRFYAEKTVFAPSLTE